MTTNSSTIESILCRIVYIITLLQRNIIRIPAIKSVDPADGRCDSTLVPSSSSSSESTSIIKLMMDNSFYLAITFLPSHHKHLLLIISVSSTNSSSSSKVTTNSNPALCNDSPVMYPTVKEMKTWDTKEVLR